MRDLFFHVDNYVRQQMTRNDSFIVMTKSRLDTSSRIESYDCVDVGEDADDAII